MATRFPTVIDTVGALRTTLARMRKEVPLGARLADGFVHGSMSAVAAIIAYVPTQFLGLREGFWSAITALAVTQTEFGAARSTARDQFAGAAIGGTIGLIVLTATGQHLASYAFAVLLSMLACWIANIASAARLAGITATIIVLVPHTGTAERMLASRVFEVGWGIVVAVSVVWLGTRLRSTQSDKAVPRAEEASANSLRGG